MNQNENLHPGCYDRELAEKILKGEWRLHTFHYKQAEVLTKELADHLSPERLAHEKELLQLQANEQVMREALTIIHKHNQESCPVFFTKEDGTPYEISVDLGEAYADSAMCDKVSQALSTNPGSALLQRLGESERDKERLDYLEKIIASGEIDKMEDGTATDAWNKTKNLRQVLDIAMDEHK